MKSDVYESAVLINAVLEDNQIESLIKRIKEYITNNGGQITDFENWGRKRLAYPIEKSKIGYYAIFRFTAPTSIIAKIERFYNLDENILRYLTIKLNKHAIEQLEKNKALQNSVKEDITSMNDKIVEVELNNEDIDN